MSERLGRPHEYETVLREAHVDLLGHVSNLAYPVLFEDARWALLSSNGYGRERILELGLGPVVIAMELRFRRELKAGEKVRIRSQVLAYRGKLSKMEQLMLKASGDVACESLYTFGLFDLKARRLVAPTPEWLRAVNCPAP